jgi:hypothetical protein
VSPPNNAARHRAPVRESALEAAPLECALAELGALEIRVASARVCDGVSAQVVVFAPDYGSEDNEQIGPGICSSHCAGATSPGSLAPAA